MLKIQLLCIPNTNVWLYILAHIKTLYTMLSLSCEGGVRVGSFVLWLYYKPLSQPDLMLFWNISLSYFSPSFFITGPKFLSLDKLPKSPSIPRHQWDRWSWQRRCFSSMPCLYPSVYLFIFRLSFDSILNRQRNKNMSFILQEWHISQPCCLSIFCLTTSV